MKTDKLFLICLLILLSLFSTAQAGKEYNIWYFGDRAGLDFNSGKPVTLSDGALSTAEGCATICDSTGKLLFYTNGVIVYNRNHEIMFRIRFFVSCRVKCESHNIS